MDSFAYHNRFVARRDALLSDSRDFFHKEHPLSFLRYRRGAQNENTANLVLFHATNHHTRKPPKLDPAVNTASLLLQNTGLKRTSQPICE